MKRHPAIETKRLVLRVGKLKEATDLADAIGDWDVISQLANVPWPYGMDEATDFIERMQFSDLPRYLIFQKSDNGEVLVGGCGVTGGPLHPKIGYWIRKSHWGRGIATEAVSAILVQLQKDGLSHLFAEHKIENMASSKVLEKLGFEVVSDASADGGVMGKVDPSLILRMKTL